MHLRRLASRGISSPRLGSITPTLSHYPSCFTNPQILKCNTQKPVFSFSSRWSSYSHSHSTLRSFCSSTQTNTQLLTTRAPSDSFIEKTFHFTTNEKLSAKYGNHFGGLRLDLLLEDLDLMAAAIAYKHAAPEGHNNPDHVIVKPSADDPYIDRGVIKQGELISGLRIVTASVNRLELFHELTLERDIKLSGCVTFVGESSMEVRIKMASIINDESSGEKEDVLLIGLFTMVARDKDDQPVKVNRLLPVTDLEKSWYVIGLENKSNRKKRSDTSLEKNPPSDKERELIHLLYLEEKEARKNEEESKKIYNLMENTRYGKTILMFPQLRNIYNKIFGGFLMRMACELAWTTALLYSQERPIFRAIDEITFLRPVTIGSIVVFESEVVFVSTESPQIIQVRVEANNIDPKTGKKTRTNDFHFTLTTKNPHLKELMPRTYEEMLRYIEGRRIVNYVKVV